MNFVPDNNSKDKRNEEEIRALQESGAHIARARFDSIPDASEFKNRLKADLMAKRELKRTSMWEKIRTGLSHIVPTQKTFVFGMVVVLLVALVSTMFINHPAGNQPGANLAELLIDRAYAKDNFEITPTSGDELAVDSTTQFIIKSKTALTKDALLPHLHLNPETPFELTQISEHEFRVTPQGTLKEKQVYNIQIDAAYKDENNTTVERDFSFAFQVKNQFKVLSSIPGNQQTGVPTNSGIELTFSSENYSNYEKSFSIEPKVDGKFEVHGRTLVFVPKELKPATIYTVTLKKSIAVKGTDPLKDDVVIKFETVAKSSQYFESAWYMNTSKAEFAPNGPMLFSVGGVDSSQEFTIKAFAFKSFDLYKKNFLKALEIPGWAFETNKNFVVPQSDITIAREFSLKPQTYKQEYSKYLVLPENLPKGDYWIEISSKNQTQHIFAEVTDLATYLDVTANKTLIWVNDLATKAVIENAQVSLATGQQLGKTNSDGIVEFGTDVLNIATRTSQGLFVPSIDSQSRGAGGTILQVSRGNESTLLTAYGNPYTLQYSMPVRDNYILHFSNDRSLYLPNDTIKFWGFVQKRDKSALPTTLTVGIPNTNNFFYGRNLGDLGMLQSVDVNPDAQGYFRGEIKLSNITAAGYSLVVKDGNTQIFNRYIEINQYVKPSYTVSITGEKNAYFAGEQVGFKAKVSFFEGTPVPKYGLSYLDNFGNNSGSVITDASGEAKWNFEAIGRQPKETCNPLEERECRGPGANRYQNIGVNNTNPEESPFTQYLSYSVYDSKVDGVIVVEQKDKTTAHVSSTWSNLDLSFLNNDDYTDDDKFFASAAKQKNVEGVVFETHYEKVEIGQYYDFISKTTEKTYSYNPVTVITSHISGKTDNKGHFETDIPVIDGRSYEVRLMVQDAEGRPALQTSYLYTGANYMPNGDMTWYSLRDRSEKENPEKITDGYKIGDQVNLDFYKNENLLDVSNGRLLFTQLQDGLQKYVVQSSPLYSFTFGENHVPNVYVGAIYFDGTKYNEVAEGSYRNNIMFDSRERELKVKIETDKSSYKPGEALKLSVQTLDKNGRGHAARVNLSVIDEAYLALLGQSPGVHTLAASNPLGGIYQALGDGTIVTARSHRAADLGNFSGAEGGGCFLAGTKILLPNGTYKNIEDITAGDSIATLKSESDSTSVIGRVLKTQKHIVSEYRIINGTLRVTPEHRILVNDAWQTAGKIQVGDTLRGEKGEPVKVTSVEIRHELVQVYNFAVETYHTYIAGGVYVHNDKGGVPTRSDFPDVALYQFVDTDASGHGSVSFKLPDSVTGWRVTAEALSNDLYAGIADQTVNVILPVFGLFSIPQDLLVGDKPSLTGAGYGVALESNDKVTLKFMGDLLNTAVVKTVAAFEQIHVGADKSVQQSGKLRLELDSKRGKDAIEKSFTAVNSRVVESAQTLIPLQNGQLDLGAAKSSVSPIELKFVDAGIGSLYYRISDLSWNGGARLDQKVGTIVSHEWFKDFFTDEELGTSQDLTPYISSEGFKLLPYGSSDVMLSAKVSAVLKDTDAFDKERMRTLFVGNLYNIDAHSGDLAASLWGAAALGEPVLPSIRTLAKSDQISQADKIRLALAATELGDNEYARTLYDELTKSVEQTDTTAHIVFDKESKNEVLENSALMSVLAARLREAMADKLDKFVHDEPKEIVVNLESLLFVKEKLAMLPKGNGNLTVSIGSQKSDVKIENGMSQSMTVVPANFASIQISNLNGPVALIAIYDKPADTNHVSNMVKLNREYFVNGQKSDSFKAGDKVEVRLTPVFGKDAPEGQYLVEDSLPSGLKITSVAEAFSPWYSSSCYGGVPFEVDGQRVKFMVDRNFQKPVPVDMSRGYAYSDGCPSSSYISYMTRVSTLGEFRKEGALIESMESNDVKNFSTDVGMLQIGE